MPIIMSQIRLRSGLLRTVCVCRDIPLILMRNAISAATSTAKLAMELALQIVPLAMMDTLYLVEPATTITLTPSIGRLVLLGLELLFLQLLLDLVGDILPFSAMRTRMELMLVTKTAITNISNILSPSPTTNIMPSKLECSYCSLMSLMRMQPFMCPETPPPTNQNSPGTSTPKELTEKCCAATTGWTM